MRYRCITLLFLFIASLPLLAADVSMASPDGRLVLTVHHAGNGQVQYSLAFRQQKVLLPSTLGFELKNPAMKLDRFDWLGADTSLVNENWSPVWGEVSSIQNHYKQLEVKLKQQGGEGILLNIVFRLFNDGLGFQYRFIKQPNLNHFIIDKELTQFHLTGDHKTFWIPGDYDTNEYTYYTTALSGVDATGGGKAQEIHAKTFFHKDAVQTPLMMKTHDNVYINIHEAALVNYPAMNLVVNKSNFTLNAHLVPDAVGNKAYLQTPAHTPWRTVIVSDKAAGILQSKMILNLNEPNVIPETSWIKPMKYVGVWWEMHIGKSSWDYSGSQVGSQQQSKVPHGANTENVKQYIDFAAKHGLDGVLVEGWNTGWEDWFGQWKENVFDFVTPYPDYNINELSAYARQKGVELIMHHETSGSVTNYERWMDTAYRFMKMHGIDAVKTGYVGRIIPRGEHHDGQWMVNHFNYAARKTAGYNIMINMHESVRLTGIHRTYPNWLASEAARGNEFNAWSSGNPPEHETILPFTRLMGGPMDYTPGIFEIKMNVYDPNKKEQVHTTLAKQLALYITMYSPIQMAADLPENYEKHLDAFQFIKDVAVDWDDTKILEAEPGDYIIMARKAKGKNEWFIGGITDEHKRSFTTPLNFLPAGQSYIATIYRDADNAHWEKNPKAYTIEKYLVDHKTSMKLKLAEGGGVAISLHPAAGISIKGIKKYK